MPWTALAYMSTMMYLESTSAAFGPAGPAWPFPLSFMNDLKALAKSEDLWNLFLPGLRQDEPGQGLSNLDYAPVAEIMGRVEWASEAFNCSAPDTGNMELLHLFATPEQSERWLKPLLEQIPLSPGHIQRGRRSLRIRLG